MKARMQQWWDVFKRVVKANLSGEHYWFIASPEFVPVKKNS
ncbi:MAG TPA: hypothetical protein PLK12_16855 [Prolixibacteraceae bacterium]|nr:hypothetical protein [Prolixibacteraceae bacterium]